MSHGPAGEPDCASFEFTTIVLSSQSLNLWHCFFTSHNIQYFRQIMFRNIQKGVSTVLPMCNSYLTQTICYSVELDCEVNKIITLF